MCNETELMPPVKELRSAKTFTYLQNRRGGGHIQSVNKECQKALMQF